MNVHFTFGNWQWVWPQPNWYIGRWVCWLGPVVLFFGTCDTTPPEFSPQGDNGNA